MELVERDTLHDPQSIKDALPIAKQIAEALEAAHDKGIIHRDLKPGDIKVTPEGVVKVLDFCLAKAVNERPTQSAADSLLPANTKELFPLSPSRGTAMYTAAADGKRFLVNVPAGDSRPLNVIANWPSLLKN